ncbi:phosphate acyltransferase PlsX [Helicobacter saguini]|uniref:Phosphate acyltransferase n=1 Tax=Helicobacter saguini TaxID=1548018 RepID=A0A347VP49_9HELI|nr:phosphate acyltransferase PlsX [Helicobacter saguini]MWV61512.1 phosphate acyltransferase PlsX [Helicobacter saguini]MWV67818.1 phosphate acyltransferase PlsX [Helicobacter saguini]MWV70714.1 phosphate acyltransferase PlsX [Helicobacter saguini]MWV72617.1 phosphate acyltransferase PlsX [Helicobacter saguini]TLD94573.1 phosphate acyltransferase PlsX [Helicobacter saguini]
MQKIALDAMGADNGVAPVIDGLRAALNHKEFKTFLVGDESEIKKHLESLSIKSLKNVEIVPTSDYIKMSEHASAANKRSESSIFKAIALVKNGDADACVSAGHSGATMSLATLQVGRIKGVSRPAICTCMPTITANPSIILDAGANTDCKPEYLYEFAIMGYHYAKSVLKYATPRVGILANGEEDSKGNELTKAVFKMLKDSDILGASFKGNVEGNDIFNGSVDVVVCDGFMGNLVLKASEGVAAAINSILKSEIKKSLLNMIGYSLAKPAFKALKAKIDYAEYGGAPLLGIKKPVIISHGKSNARAMECAIYQALNALDSNICDIIAKAFENKA